ncbi:MAG TPA: universal stress protein [Solirubrobacterales bacterium]|nr:universal stress protein [Solirubrobacterales bacterium]
MKVPHAARKGKLRRGLGVPWLFAAAYSAVGFSIYFALGVVAERGLGLTPLIFLVAGLLFGLTTLSYVEGSAMFRERGGSSAFARHAFNELVAFIAGWAILLDYLIVIALAAISLPHYLVPIWGGFDDKGSELLFAAAVIAGACLLNIMNVTGRGRQRSLAFIALADLALQLAVIVVGVIVVMHPDRLTDQIHLFSSPSLRDIIYAAVIAMLAYAGIEAASDLAPDISVSRRDLKRIASLGAVAVPLVYAGMAAIALMAVPVIATPNGPETALGSTYIQDPVLGVVSAFHPHWLAEIMRWVVALVAAPVLFWAATTSMLGVSRHTYTLAINRQIPSWLGKLEKRRATPYVAITICGLIAFGLVAATQNIKVLAGLYAFGATLAITIAHLSIIRLRITMPDKLRPFRIPWGMAWGPATLPVPAIVAALASGLAFLSVLAFHSTARWVGIGWMAFGLTFYVVYRKVFEGTSLTKRVQVGEAALTKQIPTVEFANLLVPVFGTKLDDDIVATAGRLAAAEQEEGGGDGESHLELVYVIEVPLSLPLDAELPPEREAQARRALDRAREVGEEYEDVEVSTEVIRARKTGAGIIEAARRANSEAIVIGAEPPTKIRGGGRFGGIGAAKPAEIGAATEYVLKKAPCRVLLTAPPELEPDAVVAPGADPVADLIGDPDD